MSQAQPFLFFDTQSYGVVVVRYCLWRHRLFVGVCGTGSFAHENGPVTVDIDVVNRVVEL